MLSGKQTRPITHTSFKDLVNAQAVRRVEILNDGKWWVLIHIGNVERTLHTKRGAVRQFSSLNTVENYLRSVGVQRFEVELV